jgi:acyl carrier protein
MIEKNSLESKSSLLYKAFADALGIAVADVHDELAYNTIPEWDSTAHMALIAELEGVFNVMLNTDDILELSSVSKAKDILSRHNIVFS